jgi:hypothetical protein
MERRSVEEDDCIRVICAYWLPYSLRRKNFYECPLQDFTTGAAVVEEDDDLQSEKEKKEEEAQLMTVCGQPSPLLYEQEYC